ncbi:hypothetical protein KP509_20G012200 [Ceratopteris richardii]|nr:hypothetical protein KP509_20G012200 [Ceratopteris richardii]
MEEIAVPDRLRASQTKSIPTREHSSAPATPMSLNDHRRPTECVLEEVQRKGTLVERVSDLEKRYLQLQRALSTRSTEYTVNPNESHLTPTHLRVQSHDCGQQSIKDIINLEKHAVVFSHVSVGLVKGVEKNETVLENLKGLHVNNETGADCKLPATEGRYGESPSPAPPPLRKKRRGKLPKWISNHFRMPFRKTPQLERLSVI